MADGGLTVFSRVRGFCRQAASHLPRPVTCRVTNPRPVNAVRTASHWSARIPERIRRPPGRNQRPMRGAQEISRPLKMLAVTRATGRGGIQSSAEAFWRITPCARLRRMLARAVFTADGSLSKAWTVLAPRAAQAMARMPVPVPASAAVNPGAGRWSHNRRRQVAVVAWSPVPKAMPAGMWMAGGLVDVPPARRHAAASPWTTSLPRIGRGDLRVPAGAGLAGTGAARPPKCATSRCEVFLSQYASSVIRREPGRRITTRFSGPRNPRRSTHASSHAAEAWRIQRCVSLRITHTMPKMPRA